MSIPRFDGREAWQKLDPRFQQDIGALALEMVMADWVQALPAEKLAFDACGNSVLHRAAGAALIECRSLLDETVAQALQLDIETTSPAVPSIVGDVCQECGCTENDACDGGCSWAEPDLCSACATTYTIRLPGLTA